MVLSLFGIQTPTDIEAAAVSGNPNPYRYLTAEEMLNLAFDAGFDSVQAVTIVCIAFAESGGYEGASNWNPPDYHTPVWSQDRGILQINSYHHSEVSDACAFDARCAFRESYRISHYGLEFGPWVAYRLQTHLAFKQQVEDALARKRGDEWETDP